jgi:hypothetical protein
MYGLDGQDGLNLALAWNANADQALVEHTDKLVIVCPNQGEAQALAADLVTGRAWENGRPLGVTNAALWRGSRSDHPDALLVCVRYADDETPESEDIPRYQALMRASDLPPII